jgi:hypothetical protein
MKMDENDRQKHIKYFQEVEGDDFHQVIKVQIQKAVKETARLIGLLEGGFQMAGIDSPEYKLIREFGTQFLNELVRTARRLDVQLQ